MSAAWSSRLAAVAAIAGTAATIQIIGSAVMYHRLWQVDAPVRQTVSILPKEYLFVVGARAILPSLVLGLLAVFVLYALNAAFPERKRQQAQAAETGQAAQSSAPVGSPTVVAAVTPDGPVAVTVPPAAAAPAPAPASATQNPAGALPPRYWRMIAVLLVLTAGSTWLLLDNPTVGRLGLVVLAFLVAVGVATVVVKQTEGIAGAGWALFAAILVVSVAVAIANEMDDTVKFDLVAVERENGDRVSGYFLADTGSRVYVLSPPGAIVKEGDGDAQLRVTVVDGAKKLVYGPRNVPVGRQGFLRAAKLRALLDETRPSFTTESDPDQSLSKGVTVRIACKERCRANVRATAVGSRSGRIPLSAEPRKLVRPVEARYVLTLPDDAPRVRDRRLRVRVSIVVSDVVHNHSSDVHVVTVNR